jgi:chaperonin cofactor prefoldin
MAPRQKSPLSLIFAMLIQAAMVIWAVADIKKDVEILKSRVTTQQDRDERQDRTVNEIAAELRTRLERMDTKLDRLIEKRP